MIKDLEELYRLEYKGAVLDVSALLVYIRNANETGGIQYLTGKGIDDNDAGALIADAKALMSQDASFAEAGGFSADLVNFFGTPVFSIDGNRGRHLRVYEEFVVIDVSVTVGSVLTGNAMDGQKVIFYPDCIGLQFKGPGVTVGYLQLETASPTMNNKSSNFFNENTFTFGELTKETMQAYQYIFEKIRAAKQQKQD